MHGEEETGGVARGGEREVGLAGAGRVMQHMSHLAVLRAEGGGPASTPRAQEDALNNTIYT